jgi:hypothetical protein
MDIKDLNPLETTALVALVRAGVLADGTLSANEAVAYDLLVHILGDEAYAKAAHEANARARDEDSLRALLIEVQNPEAREVIYGTLLQFASSETVDFAEDRLLEFVGKIWNITPKFEGFPAE